MTVKHEEERSLSVALSFSYRHAFCHAVVLVLELLFMGHSVRAAAVRHPQKDVGGSGVGLPERLPAQGFRGHGEPNNLICQLVRRRLVLFLYSEMAFDRWSCCG